MLALTAAAACVDPCVLSFSACDIDEDCQEGRVCRLRRTFDLPCIFAAGTCEEGQCGSVSRCEENQCCDPETNTCTAIELYSGPCDDLTCRECSQSCGDQDCGARADSATAHDAHATDSGPVDIDQADSRQADSRQTDSTRPDTNRPDLSAIDTDYPAGSCHGSATSCHELVGALERCTAQAGCWPEMSCVGLPPADCGLFGNQPECTEAGCTWDGDCDDTARPCYSLSGDLCLRQVGCSWNQLDVVCEGSAAACSTFDALSPCVNQIDCWWYPACEGEPPSCDGFLNELSCHTEPYCAWEIIQCSGSVHACSAIDTYPDCVSQLGCDWS